jgi:hypothetical protein
VGLGVKFAVLLGLGLRLRVLTLEGGVGCGRLYLLLRLGLRSRP